MAEKIQMKYFGQNQLLEFAFSWVLEKDFTIKGIVGSWNVLCYHRYQKYHLQIRKRKPNKTFMILKAKISSNSYKSPN